MTGWESLRADLRQLRDESPGALIVFPDPDCPGTASAGASTTVSCSFAFRWWSPTGESYRLAQATAGKGVTNLPN